MLVLEFIVQKTAARDSFVNFVNSATISENFTNLLLYMSQSYRTKSSNKSIIFEQMYYFVRLYAGNIGALI